MDSTNFTADKDSTLRNTVHVSCNICLQPTRHCKCNENTPQLIENTSQKKPKDKMSQAKHPINERKVMVHMLDTEIPKYMGRILIPDKNTKKPQENKTTPDPIEQTQENQNTPEESQKGNLI